MISCMDTQERIQKAAYFNFLYRQMTGIEGNELDDWLQAERSVLQSEKVEKEHYERRKYGY